MRGDVHLQFANFFAKKSSLKPFIYSLSKKMSEGHICIDTRVSIDDYNFDTDSNNDYKFEPNDALIGDSHHLNKPFILDNHLLYTQRYFKYEYNIAKRIVDFKHQPRQAYWDTDMISNLVAQYFDIKKLKAQIDWQCIGAIAALYNNFIIITGGPGTGKTTTVAKIIGMLLGLNSSLKIAIAAPTGKASARMGESLRQASAFLPNVLHQKFNAIKPATIHRLLEPIPNSIYFKRNRGHPLDIDVLVVDECSMIDIALFSKLLDALPTHCKLIMLGDKNQLSSVESGSVFGDLCNAANGGNNFSMEFVAQLEAVLGMPCNVLNHNSNPDVKLLDNVIALEVSHRFKDDEGIGVLSKAVINNDKETLETLWAFNGNNQVQIDETFSEKLKLDFYNQYKAYIIDDNGKYKSPEEALLSFSSCQILSATKEGLYSTTYFNHDIEQFLHKQGIIAIDDNWYLYKPIMITENIYNLGLYNGDIGIVFEDREDGDVRKVFFLQKDEQGNTIIKKVMPSLISYYETCYAMTIHKSQGSEFDNVMLVIDELPNNNLLSRELVYTAITRAKKRVLLQCKKDVLMGACERKIERLSGLKQRLK